MLLAWELEYVKYRVIGEKSSSSNAEFEKPELPIYREKIMNWGS